MSIIRYPDHHDNEVWNVPDGLFYHPLGLLLGGCNAARKLGYCREILYRDADKLGLTVVRRNRTDGGRYFLVTELNQLIQEHERRAKRFDKKALMKESRRF